MLRRFRSPWLWIIVACLSAAAAWAGPRYLVWRQLQDAVTALRSHDDHQAVLLLDGVLATRPDDPMANVLAARARRRLGDFSRAAEHLDHARSKVVGADSPEIAFEWSLLKATMGELAVVEDTLQARALQEHERASLIWEALVEGYRRMCRMKEALTCLEYWAELEPESSHVAWTRAEVFRQVGALTRARDDYKTVVDKQPNHPLARRRLVRCLMLTGRYAEAVEHADVLLDKSRDDAELLTWRARSLKDLGRDDMASASLQEALALDPRFGPALREQGRTALMEKRFTEAVNLLTQASNRLSNDYETQHALVQAFQGAGRLAEAKAQQAVAQDLKNRVERINEIEVKEMTLRPNDPALYAELGELLLSVGQDDSAVRWLNSALTRDPRNSVAHRALARYFASHGDEQKAKFHRSAAGM